MKLIKHKWNRKGYSIYECIKCGCFKVLQPSKIGTRSFPLIYYYRNGKQLKALPMCKSIIHCDK